MPDILLRNVPQATLDSLRRRAKQNRRSVQQELLSMLDATGYGSGTPARAQIAASIRTRLERQGRRFGDSAELVREDRER